MTNFYDDWSDWEIVSDELILARLRNWRNQKLKDSDWTQLPDAPINQTEWAEYRKELRDLPSTVKDLTKIVLPKFPIS